MNTPVLTLEEQQNIETGAWFSKLSPTLRGAILGAYVVWCFWALAGGLLRGWVPQAEQARAAALQVVLIGVLIALMLVLRPRGLIGERIDAPASRRPGG